MSISLRLRAGGLAATVVAVGLLSTSALAEDRGIAIANTREDPYGTTVQAGKVTLFYYGGVSGGFAGGRADMTHPFPPAATDASISGGYAGLYGGTPCLYQFPGFLPGALSCFRVEGSVNLSNISGTSPPNFGGEIMRAKIRSFAVVDAQVVTPIGDIFSTRNQFYGSQIGPPLFFVGFGPAVGNTFVDFAGATTSDTRFGFNAQAGLIFPIAPSAAVRVGYSFLYLGSTPIPTAAGTGHVEFWAQGINVGLEFHY